ncbi:MAG: SDR family oxidoreductase [Actinomycetia bacterium]|nr:SDR family oxidoreductase [Actinomycetes bacterium]
MTGAPKTRERRVAIVADTAQHIGPWVARKLAERGHDLVISDPNVVIEDAETSAPNLVAELKDMGGRVEVVDIDDVNAEGSVQKLVDRAMEIFGGYDSAFIRPGVHIVGPWDKATAKDLMDSAAGNTLSTQYALQAIVPPLVAQGSGQVLIEVSATGAKDFPNVAVYGATRAAAKYLINQVALDVAKHEVTLNGMGSMFCDYPGYRNSLGVTNPEAEAEAKKPIPMGRFGQPEEMAHLAAALLDGGCNYYTAQFLNMSGGWNGL